MASPSNFITEHLSVGLANSLFLATAARLEKVTVTLSWLVNRPHPCVVKLLEHRIESFQSGTYFLGGAQLCDLLKRVLNYSCGCVSEIRVLGVELLRIDIEMRWGKARSVSRLRGIDYVKRSTPDVCLCKRKKLPLAITHHS
jgi:hypothetical protein